MSTIVLLTIGASIMTTIVPLILVLVVVILIIALFSGEDVIHSHWAQLIDGMKFSTKDFYALLQKELESREVKDIKIGTVVLSEGGVASNKRLYLRVKWKEYTYDMCFAPFGRGVFVSWWLYSNPSSMETAFSRIPWVGPPLLRLFFPETFYRHDTSSMFMTYTQSCVLAVVDGITKEQGLRLLSEGERKPIMKDIFSRK
ncbi:MAG: hypothetical protein POELPBGB_01354 [Bacteroidia bacterium]|nr:hypothetical protein [Bacteroidia bacterium]